MFTVELMLFCVNIKIESGELTLDKATYNWPCENTGSSKYKPTFFKVWPWYLFIVMQKANLTGNWVLLSSNGWRKSVGNKEILGIRTVSPFLFSFTLSACILYLQICKM